MNEQGKIFTSQTLVGLKALLNLCVLSLVVVRRTSWREHTAGLADILGDDCLGDFVAAGQRLDRFISGRVIDGLSRAQPLFEDTPFKAKFAEILLGFQSAAPYCDEIATGELEQLLKPAALWLQEYLDVVQGMTIYIVESQYGSQRVAAFSPEDAQKRACAVSYRRSVDTLQESQLQEFALGVPVG